MVSASARRRAVKMSIQEDLGKVAATCRALGVARSSYYRSGRSSLENRRIRKEVLELSGKHPRYGYRRITALMRREGFEVNAKRVARIRREQGIKVSKKQRRMKRLARKNQCAVKSHGSPVGETKQTHPGTIRSARNHLEG